MFLFIGLTKGGAGFPVGDEQKECDELVSERGAKAEGFSYLNRP
jgi:hypothetical protein